MRHAPFFITLPNGNLVNVDQITFVLANRSNGCSIHFTTPTVRGNTSGSWSPGGAGSSNGSIYTDSMYIPSTLTPTELLALINKEVALVHAMEQANDNQT